MKQARFSFSCLLFSLLFLAACSDKDIRPSEEFAPYVSAYTGGPVSGSSAIYVELTQEQSVVALNTPVKEKLFSFSPKLKGHAEWVNSRTIAFIPDEGALQGGKRYTATFELGKVITVPDALKEFVFSFHVAEKNFKAALTSIDVTEEAPDLVTYNGEIRFSEGGSEEIVQKMVSLSGTSLYKITAKATDNPQVFGFSIEGVEKSKSQDNAFTILVSGRPYGISKEVKIPIVVPKSGSFTVLDARMETEGEQSIVITCSNPLSSSQDRTGLITLSVAKEFASRVEGNKIRLFFDQTFRDETIRVSIDRHLKDYQDRTLESDFEVNIPTERIAPKVEIPYSGTILPDAKKLELPFRAVNLRAVDVKVIQIFEQNVLTFLQTNSLSGSDELRRSGRLVYKQTLNLDTDAGRDLHQWNDYSIDLAPLFKREQGAIYRIVLSFKQSYSVYPCGGANTEPAAESKAQGMVQLSEGVISDEERAEWDRPTSYYYDDSSYDYDIYEWEQADNPCHPSYYMSSYKTTASCNVVASNLGVIAKQNNANRLWVSVSDIVTTDGVRGAEVTAYNYQLQVVGSGTTDGDGMAILETSGKPFIVIAAKGEQKTYLRLIDGEALSLSRFDVGGVEVQKGLKGFIYGERGVWRPGDSLFLTLILKNSGEALPAKHPVVFEVFNPRGQFHSRQVKADGLNGFYTFKIATAPSDPTGLWHAYAKVGGAQFHKALRIETIKPNRLKVNLNLPDKGIISAKSDQALRLHVEWLTGATAHGLQAAVEMSLSPTTTRFDNFKNYTFTNPASDFSTEQVELFRGHIDDNGNAAFTLKARRAENAPGMLRATVTSRVFEQGGDVSVNTQTATYSPYDVYVGIDLTNNEEAYFETDKSYNLPVATVDASGRALNCEGLEYRVYRLDWSWWWDRNDESYAGYVNSRSYTPVASGTISTKNGRATLPFRIAHEDWGRYLIYLCDTKGGHATGGVVYADWGSGYKRAGRDGLGSAQLLAFTTDKESYNLGDEVVVSIPTSAPGSAIVSLENGSTVISRTRVKTSEKGETTYRFKVTEQMAPNFYIHISLLQRHDQAKNDLPIRMYGVVAATVENKNSRLEPKIDMPDVLRPETAFTVKVSEQKGRAMTYTLAIVDDGLLDLTGFRTPDPWSAFFAREALGIRTWDMYDLVVGSFASKYGSVFSIGGDEALKQSNKQANRFNPVVKFLGPFTLAKGKSNQHNITLPMYVGSVRTMVVAGQDGAYGNAEKTSAVRAPLMLFASLPRVASTNEKMDLPINLFVMENSVKQVSVTVKTTGLLRLSDKATKSVTFTATGDKMLYYALTTADKTGIETVTITATGGGKTVSQTIEIDVRNPNPPASTTRTALIEAGKRGELSYTLSAPTAESLVLLEVSRLPSLDFSSRFDFLCNYQHFCTEQLVSRTFPLLYIGDFKELSADEKEKTNRNIREAIGQLYGRQFGNGGFVYWSGMNDANDWITSYAGHFLVAAKERGFEVNASVLSRWTSYQRRVAQNWRFAAVSDFYNGQTELQQAYRLYTLALAGTPELGVMNRLKESNTLNIRTKWRLAAAYALCGKNKAAEELAYGAPTAVADYASNSMTYGSATRDKAMIIETLVLMGRMQEAFKIAAELSAEMSHETSFTTQSTAYGLIAMAALAQKTSGNIAYSWTIDGAQQKAVTTGKTLVQTVLKPRSAASVAVTNNGKGALYVTLTTRFRPMVDSLPAANNGIALHVTYTDMAGKTIDPSHLKQGSDFFAHIEVTNSSSRALENLALTQITPSGWEIFNDRLQASEGETSSKYSYRDIRDDRVMTYFDLPYGHKVTLTTRLQASYTGDFVLPAVVCEAMYDATVNARTKAGRAVVAR